MKYQEYPAYKESGVEWLGKIPERWRIQKLKFLTRPSDERNGQTPHGDMLSVSGYRGIEVKDYEFEEQRREDGDLETYRVVHEGQLVVNTMWLNYAGLGVSRYEGHVSPAYKAFYISEEVEKWFIHHFLRCTASVEGYKKYLRGIRPNSLQMPSEDFEAFPVILPPLPTQQAIATFLDTETARIDSLIKGYEELVSLLQEKRQALISHAVTRGLSELVSSDDPDFGEWAKPVKFKDSGVEWLGEIPEGWYVSKIGYLTSFVSGATPSKDNDFFWNGTIPWVSPKDMKVKEVWDSEDHVSELAVTESGLKLIPTCDLLIVVRGMILIRDFPVAITMVPVTINQDMKAIHVDDLVVACFLYSYLVGIREQVLSFYVEEAAHGTLAIRMDVFKGLPILVPNKTEQLSIAAFLDKETAKMDTLVTETKSAIELLKEHRSALITNAVTGKIKVDNLYE